MNHVFNFKLTTVFFVFIYLFKDGHGLSSIEAVKRFFEYFRSPDPLGLPVLGLPEPMPLPDPLELIPVSLQKGELFGHSRTKIHRVDIDFGSLEGSFKCSIPYMKLTGNYSWPSFVRTSRGFIQGEVYDVEMHVNFSMYINPEDALQIRDFENFLLIDEMDLVMNDLLWVHQLILDSGTLDIFLYDILKELTRQLKPLILDSTNSYFGEIFNSIPLADDAIWEAKSSIVAPAKGTTQASHAAFFLRRILQYFGADPLRIPKVRFSELGMKFEFTDIRLEGLSYIGRIEKLWVVYQDGKIYVLSSMLYPNLLVSSRMHFKSFFMKVRQNVNIEMEYAEIRINLVIDPSQMEAPKITDFGFQIAGFRSQKTSKNIFNKLLSSSAKHIFNFFISEMKGKIKRAIQKKLDQVRLEESAIYFLEH